MPGGTVDVADTCSFSAGGVAFQLELPPNRADEALATKPPLWKSMLLLSIGVVTLCGATVIGAFVLGNGGPARSVAATLTSRSGIPGASAVSVAAAFLRERVDGAGISGLSVKPREDGAIVVVGMLPPDRQQEWAALRREYDERFGNSRVLVEQFEEPASLPSLHVAAVWSGANPYVVDDHGSRLRPGASLGDGWSIEKIDGQTIVIRRGDRRLALGY
jgi:hypothetical protein